MPACSFTLTCLKFLSCLNPNIPQALDSRPCNYCRSQTLIPGPMLILPMIQESLSSGSKQRATAWSLRKQLLESLTSQTSLIRERDQTRIQFQKEVQKTMFKNKKCWQVGMCICGAAGVESKLAWQIHSRLASRLKEVCWSRKNEKSPTRQLLEQGRLVLRLWSVEDELHSEAWLHIGFTNFTSWFMSVHKMVRADEEDDAMSGAVGGHRSFVLLKSLALDGRGAGSPDCFQMSWQAIYEDMNCDDRLQCAIHSMDISHTQLPLHRMQLGYVRVRPTLDEERVVCVYGWGDSR